MFIANSRFENPLLSALGVDGDRYFRAMELSGRLPWFIVTCVMHDEELEMMRSFAALGMRTCSHF